MSAGLTSFVPITLDQLFGTRRMFCFQAKGPSSYPTGGFDPQFLNVAGIQIPEFVFVESQSGYQYILNRTTGKMQAFDPTAAGGLTFSGSALAAHSHGLQPVVEEAVTVTTSVGTLANIPGGIFSVYASAGSVTGPCSIIPHTGTPATHQVAVNWGAGTLTFNSGTDAVTAAVVTYIAKGKAATAPPLTSDSAGTPAGTLSGASADTEVPNATDISADLLTITFWFGMES